MGHADTDVPHYRRETLTDRVSALFPVSAPRLECVVYAVETERGPVLVDCGGGALWQQLVEAVGGRPETILLTHCHIDHAGACAAAVEQVGRIYAHPGAIEAFLADPRRIWYEQPDKVKSPPSEVLSPIMDAQRIQFGDVEFAAMATPGHTADHLAYLLETERGLVAFCGDLVTPEGQPGWAGSSDFDSGALIGSLRRMLALQPAMLLGGHWVMRKPEAVLTRALELARTRTWRFTGREAE